MKKKILTLCMAIMLVVISSIPVFAAGYTCPYCGASAYSVGCTGSEYAVRTDILCADHGVRDLTFYYYYSYFNCTKCGATNFTIPDGGAHLHYRYDSTSDSKLKYVCQFNG